MTATLLERAAHTRPAATRRGALERLFTLMFKGFVYNQIWEDPEVDLEALALAPHHRLLTIASGGCNVLNYLAADPARIIAVDLNANHVALTRLKLEAALAEPSPRVEEIKRDLAEMEHMIDEYLAFARGEDGEALEIVGLRGLIQEVSEGATRAGAQVQVDAEGGAGHVGRGDSLELGRRPSGRADDLLVIPCAAAVEQVREAPCR